MTHARQRGSWELYIQQQSQTQSFTGEVVEANTAAGTCLVRFSGGKTLTCECRRDAVLRPGDRVLASRVPNRTRLVIQGRGAAVTKVTTVTHYTRGGGGGETNIRPPGLDAPTSLTAVLAGGDTQLNWTGVTGATYYHIERSSNGTGFTQIDIISAALTAYTDVGADARYWYRVRAVSGTVVSAYSNIAVTAMPSVSPSESESASVSPSASASG